MKTVKPQPLHAEHIRYGLGEILSVRQLDGGGVFVADVKFADGTQRTIRLAPQYWVGDTTGLILTTPQCGQIKKRNNQMSDTEIIGKYVSEAQQKRFWGSLQLDFQDGNLSLIRKEETIKIQTRTGNNRDDSQPRF